MFPGGNNAHGNACSALHLRRLLRPWDRFFRDEERLSPRSRGLSPSRSSPVQPLKAAPHHWARTVTQGPPSPCLRGTAAGAASTVRVTPSGQLSLCPTSGSPLEAPPHWTGHGQDKAGSGMRDRNPRDLMLMNEKTL